MSRPNPPALTVRYDGSTRSFAPGNDVVVGRDLRADVRIAHPLISRAHLVLRFDQGRWVAIDNGSLNGVYVNGRRVPTVDLRDGQQVNIGSPDGPGLTFEVGRHQGSAGTPPQTTAGPLASRPRPRNPSQPPPPPPTPRPRIHPPAPPPPKQPGDPSRPPPRYPPRPPPTRSSRCIRPDRSRDTRRVRRPTPAARRRIRRARRSPSGQQRWPSRSPPQVWNQSRRRVRRPRRARVRATSRRACSRSCG